MELLFQSKETDKNKQHAYINVVYQTMINTKKKNEAGNGDWECSKAWRGQDAI